MVITCICNSITENKTFPHVLKKGIIIPIPKGSKDPTIQNNNRGITLVSVIVNIYQKVVLGRHMEWLKGVNKLDALQGAAQPGTLSLHTAWMLRETIAAKQEQGNTVYVALLDTTKAFDTVWVNGLFHKISTKMDKKLWRILYRFYQHFHCSVQIGGVLSDWFTSGQGVHQGEPWSMYLYMEMIDALLVSLRQAGIGTTIGNIHIGNPGYADDIAIVTIHKPLLQKLLNIAYSYSQQWRFEFNASKTEIIIFGKDYSPHSTLQLGGNEIQAKAGGMHMGVHLTYDSKYEGTAVQDKINAGERAYYAVQGLGNKHLPGKINGCNN